MRPMVRADGVALLVHLFENFRVIGGVLADREENRLCASLRASALSTAGVLFGHGPSSKVSTTSLSRRKSCILKCSKPKPGPPVVSISTVRAMPMASRVGARGLCGSRGGRRRRCGRRLFRCARGLGPDRPQRHQRNRTRNQQSRRLTHHQPHDPAWFRRGKRLGWPRD